MHCNSTFRITSFEGRDRHYRNYHIESDRTRKNQWKNVQITDTIKNTHFPQYNQVVHVV